MLQLCSSLMYAKQTKLKIFSPFSVKGSFCYHTVFQHPPPNRLPMIWPICWNSTEGRMQKLQSCRKPEEGWAHLLSQTMHKKCFRAPTLQLHFDLLNDIPWVWLAEIAQGFLLHDSKGRQQPHCSISDGITQPAWKTAPLNWICTVPLKAAV